jgi:hypothetical protein
LAPSRPEGQPTHAPYRFSVTLQWVLWFPVLAFSSTVMGVFDREKLPTFGRMVIESTQWVSPRRRPMHGSRLPTRPIYTEPSLTFSDLQAPELRRAKNRVPGASCELTPVIAWENASSNFNLALRIPSQDRWERA